MARVPIPVAGAGEQLRPLPDASLVPANIHAGGQMVGQALQQTGQFLNDASKEQENINNALDMAAVKKADTEDSNYLRERLWTGDNAFYNLQGFNAANARTPLEQELRDRRAQTRASLTSEHQRKLYDMASEQRYGPEFQGIARYSGSQLVEEEKRQSNSRIVASGNDAVTFWDDPSKRGKAVADIDSELTDQAVKNGWGAETLTAAKKSALSNITTRAIKWKLDKGDIEGAQATLEANRQALDPDAESAIDGQLFQPLMERRISGLADSLMGTAPPTDVSSAAAMKPGAVLPRMAQITAYTESRGRDRDKGGNIVTSPKGAQGSMQVMPGTNTDPGFGVKPAADSTDAERARVGKDYLAAMMSRYGNDPAKAWAAYNAGPGRLDAVLADPKKRGNWIAYVPKETQDYVRANMAALGGGSNAQATPREWNLTEMLAKVDGMDLPFEDRRQLKQEITRRISTDETLLDRQRKDAEDEAYKYVERQGDGFAGQKDLPVSVRARLTPQQRLTFDAIGERNINKAREKTDWTTFSEVSDSFAKNPTAFLSQYSPAEMRAKLGDTEFKQFLSWRQIAQANPNGKSQEQINLSRVSSVTDPLISAAGITRPPEKNGKRDETLDQAYWQRVSQYRLSVLGDVQRWQAANPNKDLDDVTLSQIADRQLIKMYQRAPNGERYLGFAFETGGAAQPGQFFKMDTGQVERIKQLYMKRWGRQPSESEIVEIYRYGPRGGK